MSIIQFIQYTPEQLQADIRAAVKKTLADLVNQASKESSKEMLTRHEVAELLQVNLSTIHNWCKKGKLKPYGIGKRVYFKRSDIETSFTYIGKANVGGLR